MGCFVEKDTDKFILKHVWQNLLVNSHTGRGLNHIVCLKTKLSVIGKRCDRKRGAKNPGHFHNDTLGRLLLVVVILENLTRQAVPHTQSLISSKSTTHSISLVNGT